MLVINNNFMKIAKENPTTSSIILAEIYQTPSIKITPMGYSLDFKVDGRDIFEWDSNKISEEHIIELQKVLKKIRDSYR